MHRFRAALVVGSALCTLLAVGGPATADSNPPGNNGTVKVGGLAFDDGSGNQPHIDCLFEIDFFGFDQGNLTGTATFELQPPSGNAVLLVDSTAIGEDQAGGANDFDASLIEDLSGPIASSGAIADPNQGFHVRLTIQAEGSIGAMTKHKTYWVDGCEGGEGGGEA
jgi:hypothetical protein